MASVNMTIQIDAILKQQAETLFESLGLDLSTAVNIFLRQCIRDGGLPFSLDRSFDSPENIHYLEKVTQEIDAGKTPLHYHPLTKV